MLRLKGLISNAKNLINYLYYIKFSLSKNVYPCKLIGQETGYQGQETIIIYKIIGKPSIAKVPLQNLLAKKNAVAKFHPKDAVKLGSLAYEDLIHPLPDNKIEKFQEIKISMLNSAHDIYHDTYSKVPPTSINDHSNISNPDIELNYLDLISEKNIYPCKLVGEKSEEKAKDTMIIFTVFGKREGYKKSLKEIIQDQLMISRFHPTEALKFGFIASGDRENP